MANAATKLRTEAAAALRASSDLGNLLVPGNIIISPALYSVSPWANLGGLTITPRYVLTDGKYFSLLNDADGGATLYLRQTGDHIGFLSGVYTFAVDIVSSSSAPNCPRIAVVTGAGTKAVYWDGSLSQVVPDPVSPPTAYGFTLSASGASVRIWMTVTLTSFSQNAVHIVPAACPNGGPYALDPTLTGNVYVTNAGLYAGSVSTYPDLTNPQRIFEGDAGYLGGRNRGRLPFIEIIGPANHYEPTTIDGGMLTQNLTMRMHAGGADIAVAEALLENMATLTAREIRLMLDSTTLAARYAAIGATDIGAPVAGPWGWQLDVNMSVQQTYEAATQEYT